jgi:hypothetical protein
MKKALLVLSLAAVSTLTASVPVVAQTVQHDANFEIPATDDGLPGDGVSSRTGLFPTDHDRI